MGRRVRRNRHRYGSPFVVREFFRVRVRLRPSVRLSHTARQFARSANWSTDQWQSSRLRIGAIARALSRVGNRRELKGADEMFSQESNVICMILGAALFATEGHTCSVTEIISNVDMVTAADAVVRARAIEYASLPSDPNIRTTGVPDSRVRFKLIEIIHGQRISNLTLPGYVVQADDFNDQPAPYTFVRPGGRSGSCFANSYREGAEFLLFLKKTEDGAFTVNWAPLAPVNEQLHSADDPWVVWVREQAQKAKGVPKR
jgi:hypothetical protein